MWCGRSRSWADNESNRRCHGIANSCLGVAQRAAPLRKATSRIYKCAPRCCCFDQHPLRKAARCPQAQCCKGPACTQTWRRHVRARAPEWSAKRSDRQPLAFRTRLRCFSSSSHVRLLSCPTCSETRLETRLLVGPEGGAALSCAALYRRLQQASFRAALAASVAVHGRRRPPFTAHSHVLQMGSVEGAATGGSPSAQLILTGLPNHILDTLAAQLDGQARCVSFSLLACSPLSLNRSRRRRIAHCVHHPLQVVALSHLPQPAAGGAALVCPCEGDAPPGARLHLLGELVTQPRGRSGMPGVGGRP